MNDDYFMIAKANEQITTTDIKGKDYAQVNERIKAFRMCHPHGCITTSIVSLEDGTVTMLATVSDANGQVLGTGYAQEKENSSYINKTSFIENCETSAVGRALGMCGFGIDVSIASAEELENAMRNQEIEEKKIATLSEEYTKMRTNLTSLNCDFRDAKTNDFICKHAKVKTQDIRLLDSASLERLCKFYQAMIDKKENRAEGKEE